LPVAKKIFSVHQHLKALAVLPVCPPPISLEVVKPMPGEGVPPPKAAAPPENPIEIPTGDPTVPVVSLPVREMTVIQPAGLMPVKGADRSFGYVSIA